MADLRNLEFDRQPIKSVKGDVENLKFCETDAKEIQEMVASLSTLDYWHPIRNAAQPFMEKYIMSGVDEYVTTTYGSSILAPASIFGLKPSKHAYTLKMIADGDDTLVGLAYGDFVELCEVVRRVPYRSTVNRFSNSVDLYVACMESLVSGENLSQAVTLYAFSRHRKRGLSDKLMADLNDQCQTYADTYYKEGKRIADQFGSSLFWYSYGMYKHIAMAWQHAIADDMFTYGVDNLNLNGMPLQAVEVLSKSLASLPFRCAPTFSFAQKLKVMDMLSSISYQLTPIIELATQGQALSEIAALPLIHYGSWRQTYDDNLRWIVDGLEDGQLMATIVKNHSYDEYGNYSESREAMVVDNLIFNGFPI